MSDSPGLVDLAVGLVNFIFQLPDGQVKVLSELFFEGINLIHCTCGNFFTLVKITSGLEHPGNSNFPGCPMFGPAGKLNFVVPWPIMRQMVTFES